MLSCLCWWATQTQIGAIPIRHARPKEGPQHWMCVKSAWKTGWSTLTIPGFSFSINSVVAAHRFGTIYHRPAATACPTNIYIYMFACRFCRRSLRPPLCGVHLFLGHICWHLFANLYGILAQSVGWCYVQRGLVQGSIQPERNRHQGRRPDFPPKTLECIRKTI